MIRYKQCFNILIDGTKRYESSVLLELERMRKTWTGWAVLKSIFDAGLNKKEIRITAYTDEDKKDLGDDNAYAQAKSGSNAAPREALVFMGGADKYDTPHDERFRNLGFTGTGAGSDAEVHYTPGVRIPRCPKGGKKVTGSCRLPWASDKAPDDTLLHELIHALRQLRGQCNFVPTWTKDYDNEEEFFAIVLTNTHMSEKGSKFLRANHHGHGVLDDSLTGSEKFLGKDVPVITTEQLENRRLINKLVCENHDLCSNVRQYVKADFNPIGEYLMHWSHYPHDPKKAYAVNGK